jgi:hypothetical protein
MAKQRTSQKSQTSERPFTRRKGKNPTPTSELEGVCAARTLPHEEIAARAYGHFLARGGGHGDDWGDWFRAEAELRETDQGAAPWGTSHGGRAFAFQRGRVWS